MCVHTIVEYPFCDSPNIYLTTAEARILEDKVKQICRKYSFIPCEKYETTGQLCVKYYKDEDQYRADILARPDTIIRIELRDCNMRRNSNWHACKVGAGRRKTDQFSKPIVVDGELNVGPERKFKPGPEGEVLKGVIEGAQRNWDTLPA